MENLKYRPTTKYADPYGTGDKQPRQVFEVYAPLEDAHKYNYTKAAKDRGRIIATVADEGLAKLIVNAARTRKALVLLEASAQLHINGEASDWTGEKFILAQEEALQCINL